MLCTLASWSLLNLSLDMLAGVLQLPVCILEMQPCSVFSILLSYVQNVRLGLSIHHCEQKQLCSALKCQVWMVSHITDKLTHVYLAGKKKDLPEQIHKNCKLFGQGVDGFHFKWLIFIVLRMIFFFFFPFFWLPLFGCIWIWWTWRLSHISGQ